jgi:DNA-binding MarR family transcriptional regulator
MSAAAAAHQLTELVDVVVRLNGILLAEGDALTAPFGVTAARWLVLGALADAPLSIAEVARRRGLTRQSVRESALRLERDGFITRVADPDDARAPVLTPTAKARQFLEEIETIRVGWAQGASTSIETAALDTTLSVLRQLSAALSAKP